MSHDKNMQEVDELISAVADLLDQLVARRGRDKKVAQLKIAVVLYLRLAYGLGAAHAIQDFIKGTVGIGGGNGHNGQRGDPSPGAAK